MWGRKRNTQAAMRGSTRNKHTAPKGYRRKHVQPRGGRKRITQAAMFAPGSAASSTGASASTGAIMVGTTLASSVLIGNTTLLVRSYPPATASARTAKG
eukprot:gene13803-22480_t